MSSPFQTSVLRTHLNGIDGHACKEAYDRHQSHFGNRNMQDTILGMKEEEYQYGFLEDLFVKVLGYTLKPQADYNLEAEKKNPANSKKADGAILNDLGDVHCVIELKGTDTIDLNRVEAQGFGYLNANPGCRYLVTSNFARLRFYLGDTTAYLEWDLFNLSYEDFRTLWLCLERQSLLADRAMRVREESTVKEEEITKELYRDYSNFKRELFTHLRENHPDVSPLRLFQLTQKLLDRLLFVFFGEDKGLLPPNTASKPIGDFDKLREIDAGQPLYQLLIKYFNYIDTGTKRKDFEIPAYNGGLFAPDPELDALKIPDPILRKHLLKLTAYKFDSEVDVNILGHIFEHSLNEIEEVQAELRGEALDKSKTKRKKDGVFYTPRYITKYIVENTVGRLCTEKRSELGIDEQDYARGRKRRKKATIKALGATLETYRAWLLDLKICDPACGSGAFLNEALNFLIAEHENVSELERQLFDAAIAFDPGPAILENNLYGVDINDEAVEIARLSLWLRTAQKGRKLTDLSGRIKVGNSLIDDPAVAGDKAFVWVEEFPEVFGEGSRGGFDVVVGNPPYVRIQTIRSSDEAVADYLEDNYETATGRFDLYILFLELVEKIQQSRGRTSMITPNNYLKSSYGKGLRSMYSNSKKIEEIIDFGNFLVFEDASTYTNIITISSENSTLRFANAHNEEIQHLGFSEADYTHFTDSGWNLVSDEHRKIIKKVNGQPDKMKDVFEGVRQGVVTGDNDCFYLYNSEERNLEVTGYNKALESRVTVEKYLAFPLAHGKNVGRYGYIPDGVFAVYPYERSGDDSSLITEDYMLLDYPLGYSMFEPLKPRLSGRGSKTMKYDSWLAYWNSRRYGLFYRKGILTPDICYRGSMALVGERVMHNDTCYKLVPQKTTTTSLKVYLSILNSELIWKYLTWTGSVLRGGYFRFKSNSISPISYPAVEKKIEKNVCQLVDLMIDIKSKSSKNIATFLRLLQRNFPALEKLSKKLQDWPSLDYAAFVKELNKALKKYKQPKLSLNQEMEWESIFEAKRAEVMALRAEITKLDREIDVAVYRLYGLTWEEVLVVDAGVVEWMSEREYVGN